MKTHTKNSVYVNVGLMLMILFALGTSCNSVQAPTTDIHAAALIGDLETIKLHIKAGTDLNQKEPAVGSTALITAAVFGKTEVVEALLEAGAEINIQNNEGSSALHSATFLGRLEIVEILLAHGADKTLKNIYGSTAQESISAPFEMVKPIYDQFSADLGPLGLKLDYKELEDARPKIAKILSNN